MKPDAAGKPPSHLLVLFMEVFPRADGIRLLMYVVLSLGAAFVGSLAAVLAVPLVQPGHALSLGGFVLAASSSVDVQVIWFLVATMALALLRWQSARLGALLVSSCGMTLRSRVHASLIHAPLSGLADSTSAEIANVLTHNVEILAQGFNALLQLSVAALTSLVTLGFALCVSPALLFAVPVLLGLGLIASRAYGQELAQVSRQYVTDITQLFWFSEDFPKRLRHIRSFQREDTEKAGYAAISERLGWGYRRQLELVASGRLVLELLGACGIAAMFMLAAHWHGVERGSLIAVCLLLGRLLPYLVSTRQGFQHLRSAMPALALWQRYARIEGDALADGCMDAARSSGLLCIERITLKHPCAGLEVERLVLVPGELTLICGNSGIGKSSLLDVLAGMVAPERFVAALGAARIDFSQYRNWVKYGAYVSQHVRPWQRSVRECLLWAAPDATEDMLWQALEDVSLTSRLGRSLHGLDAALGSASNRFSGGELQRLMLAQVILRQPSVALLDEATSALDVASELAVLATLKRRLPKTVLVVVSHRPEVMSVADTRVYIGNEKIDVMAREKICGRCMLER